MMETRLSIRLRAEGCAGARPPAVDRGAHHFPKHLENESDIAELSTKKV